MILRGYPSILFDGCCEAALEAYCDIFRGKVSNMLRMGDLRFPMPDEEKKRIFQAVFQARGLYFLACDTFPGHQPSVGANIYLSVDFSNVPQAKACYEALHEKGKVIMPFSDTEYSLGYGKVCDRFGIYWELNVPKGPQRILMTVGAWRS